MSLFKNYLFNVMTTISVILFGILTFPYISRILMPEYLGKITFCQSISFYFTTLALLGIPTYAIRELSRHKDNLEKFKQIFTELFIISILGSIFSFVIFQILINFSFRLFEHKKILNIFSIQILFSFFNVDYMFIVLEKHKRRVIRNTILRLTLLIFIFISIKSQEDYLKYTLIITFPEIVMKIIDFYYVKEYFTFNRKLNLNKHLKSLIILFLTTISISLYDQIDSTMLGFILTDKDVGLYSSAVKMSRILIPIIASLSVVIAPGLIQSIKSGKENEIYEKIDIFLDFNFIFGVQIICFLFILSKEIILLFSGEMYVEAFQTMRLILPIILFISIGSFVGGRLLTGNNLEKIPLKCNLIALVANILMNLYLIPNYGYFGAGISTLLTEFISCILKIINLKKIYPNYIFLTRDRIKYVILGLFISIIIIFIKSYFIKIEGFLLIVLLLSIYLLLYVGLLILLKDKILKKIYMKGLCKY